MCIETRIETSAKLRRSGMETNGINATIVLGRGGDMSPRWGWEYYFGVGFYKHVAPLGLGLGGALPAIHMSRLWRWGLAWTWPAIYMPRLWRWAKRLKPTIVSGGLVKIY